MGEAMKKLVLLLPLFLGGCAVMDALLPSAENYSANIVEIRDATQYGKDRTKCLAASHFKRGFDLPTVGVATVSGAANNAGYGTVYGPAPVAAGAASEGISSALTGFGANGKASIVRYVKCMEAYMNEDHSFIIADENG